MAWGAVEQAKAVILARAVPSILGGLPERGRSCKAESKPVVRYRRLILKMVCKLKLKVAAISVGCRPRCSKSRTRARVLTRAGVEPRRKSYQRTSLTS
jgi:hypothetical protein